jgi:hypothetical protein
MYSVTTTIGETIYVPSLFSSLPEYRKDLIIHHELVHVKQYKKERFLFFIKYLLLPVPTIFANYRLEYEIDAYARTIAYGHKTYRINIPFEVEFAVDSLTGPTYLWTSLNKENVRKRLQERIQLYLL